MTTKHKCTGCPIFTQCLGSPGQFIYSANKCQFCGYWFIKNFRFQPTFCDQLRNHADVALMSLAGSLRTAKAVCKEPECQEKMAREEARFAGPEEYRFGPIYGSNQYSGDDQ